ncbi:MAG: HlyD family type I secretion periplasmic adaptor subunit [Hyphomicrobiaceae bacterium]
MIDGKLAAPSAPTNYRPYIFFGYMTALIVFVGFGGWASHAPLDSAAVAQGMVVLESNRRTVQHLEGGIIDEIFIKETDYVKEGDLLMRLRPIQAEATQETQLNALDSALVLEARLLAERDGKDVIVFPAQLKSRADRPLTRKFMNDQLRQFADRRASLNNQISIIQNRISQLDSQGQGLRSTLEAATKSLASLQAEWARIEPVVDKGFISVNRSSEHQRRMAEADGRVGQIQADLSKNSEAIDENRLQIIQMERKFQEDVAQALREVRLQVSEITAKLQIAQDIFSRIEIRAPTSGMVQNLRFHTLGGVLRPGEPICEVIPSNDTLNIQARVSPTDATYVRKGQEAEVRFPGYRDRHAPTILGKVRERSQDTVRDEASKEPYFLAVIEVKESTLPAGLRGTLTAGMPADVMIITGERTALDYLLRPLVDAIRPAGREQ